jgi:hypothetical protein
MFGPGPSPVERWVDFSRRSMGLLTRRGSLLALAITPFVLWDELMIVPPSRLTAGIVELLLAFAIAYAFPTLLKIRHRPVLRLFLWDQQSLRQRDAGRSGAEQEADARLDGLLKTRTDDPARWREVRAIAAELKPAVRREHVLAVADIFENDAIDLTQYEAAIAELSDEATRRHWRVQLAMARGFAEFVGRGDYMKPLLEAAAAEAPLPLAAAVRIRFWVVGWLVPGLFLVMAGLLALTMAFV